MYSQIIFKRCLKNCVDPFSFSVQKYLVHDLNPTCNSDNPNLTVIFFHGIAFGTNDEWKETWTTRPTNNREECICWPEKWLPEDLNNNVRILFLSYNSNIVASVHNDVTKIGKNLIQSLIINSSYQSLWYGPLALVAYSFGVPYASAIQLSNNNNYKIEDANHLTICKPPNKDHPSYSLLLKCLRICIEKHILLPPMPCHEVELIDKAKDINILLQKESIVGLVGMGGIGKTTLCKKFYHLFHNQYDKSSFLEDVKSKDNIDDVIKQLLHDLCGICKDKNVNKNDLDRIRQCMISEKMLVVVDDVAKAENLTSLQLLIATKNATPKSKVLVNCRNWQILKSHVREDGKMVMKSLEEKQATELFMFHAFGNANHVPTKDLKDICMKIIKACGGLPLSLKVLGSFLCNTKKLEIWEGALRKLKSGQNLTGGSDNEELWNVLKISYDNLDKQHQNMFLDIACFLGSLKISTICRVLSGDYLNPKFELQNLQHRSLIQWSKDGILYIHEQLRDMGQYIAREPPIMNRFIWKSNMSNFFLPKDELKGISQP
ncbi:unnamed protein product [Sphagnum jensenii]|uniref:NB-ARC domain-containing protein n=1 Tax=Sphagnum jensenii TaxID=128206 RepID=A0ABP1BX64_9BRYO